MKLPLTLTLATFALGSFASFASAEVLNSAEITQAVKDVKVYQGKAEGRPATIGETIDKSSSVTTGRRSRAELTFQDKTITRLGQNSIFSFRKGGREVELKRGSILLQVPKNAGGATIRTATVTAAITGTTSMLEYSPGQWVKLVTLEGTQKLFIKGRKNPIPVPAGSMVVVSLQNDDEPRIFNIDIAKLLRTSKLVDKDIFRDLPEHAKDSIAKTVDVQEDGKRDGTYLPTRKVFVGPSFGSSSRGNEARIVEEGNYSMPGYSFPNTNP